MNEKGNTEKIFEFTVFTPTYNRGYILPVLYKSLQAQKVKNFEWLIVDDGSSDNTDEIVKNWVDEEKSFLVRYYKTENVGKPSAINYGMERAEGQYFFIVDSDDYLRPDTIEKFTEWIKDIDDNNSFVGIGAAKCYPNGEYVKGVPPKTNDKGYVDATNLERHKYDLDADMCEAYKIDILRKYPMAVWPGEKFAPEQISINAMALDGYKVRWHRDIVYVCDYLDDGLTKGANSLLKRNPMGYAMMYNNMLRYDLPAKKKLFAASQFIALSICGKNAKYILKGYNKMYTVLALPYGIALSFRRRRQLLND